jgi:hypothetical protein
VVEWIAEIELTPELRYAPELSVEFGVKLSKLIKVPNCGDKPVGIPLEPPLRFGVPVTRTVALRTEANAQRADPDNKALSKGIVSSLPNHRHEMFKGDEIC